MTVLFVVLPLAVFFSALAVAAFLWSAKTGQLDDLETPPLRILRDDARPVPNPTIDETPKRIRTVVSWRSGSSSSRSSS